MVFEEPKVEFVHFGKNDIVADSWYCSDGTASNDPYGAAIRICSGQAFGAEEEEDCDPGNAGSL